MRPGWERRVKAENLKRAKTIHDIFTPGVTPVEKGVHICVEAEAKTCSLIVYEEGKKRGKRFDFLPEQRTGNLWGMELLGEDFSGLEYVLEIDGVQTADPFGREYGGRARWGVKSRPETVARARFVRDFGDWEGDQRPCRPFEETVIYRLHVRGFTRHASSHTENRGTFQAITEKIPYLKELGVTAVELMPPYEFDEVMEPSRRPGEPAVTGRAAAGMPAMAGQTAAPVIREQPLRINYWGYGPGRLFAPKAAYAAGGRACREFGDLVRALHRNGLELILELYFSGKESPSLVQEIVRFWVYAYHVDGIHLVGPAAADFLAADPLLADTKLLASSWNETTKGPADGMSREGRALRRHLAEYNDGFQMDMRRFLKGDEDQLNGVIFRTRRNPAGCAVINYMANTNGFTMADMVSYERKHNEANGEDNRDGSDYNATWNCGEEGPSRKKKIRLMRKKQLRNAFVLLFLSQGTPLLMAGDEFGNSAGGNNNAYCQDNEVSWLDWRQLETNRPLFEFVRHLIAFRREHPVFHGSTEPRNMDYLACGHPDVSYHGVRAWCPEFESFRRQLGILYCGEYGRRADKTPDDFFFVAYNMHWEPHEFALPKLPAGLAWHLCLNTDEEARNGIYESGSEPEAEDQKRFLVPPRSIVVFGGFAPRRETGKEKRRNPAGNAVSAEDRNPAGNVSEDNQRERE